MSEQGPAGQEPEAGTGRPPGPDGAGAGPGGPGDRRLPDGAVEVRVRRAPKYLPFIVTGVVVGVLLGVVVAFAFGDPAQAERFSRSTLVRYFAAILGLLGGLVGAAAAVLLERRR